MSGNKQTGLTHLHVYTFVIYRTERGTVAMYPPEASASRYDNTSNSPTLFRNLNESIGWMYTREPYDSIITL